MSALFVVAAVDDAVRAGAMSVLVVLPHELFDEMSSDVLKVLGGLPAGMPLMGGYRAEMLLRRPSRNGVTSFVTVSFEPWMQTPKWSAYWDSMVFVNAFDERRELWMEFMKDYLTPGNAGQSTVVWAEGSL